MKFLNKQSWQSVSINKSSLPFCCKNYRKMIVINQLNLNLKLLWNSENLIQVPWKVYPRWKPETATFGKYNTSDICHEGRPINIYWQWRSMNRWSLVDWDICFGTYHSLKKSNIPIKSNSFIFQYRTRIFYKLSMTQLTSSTSWGKKSIETFTQSNNSPVQVL